MCQLTEAPALRKRSTTRVPSWAGEGATRVRVGVQGVRGELLTCEWFVPLKPRAPALASDTTMAAPGMLSTVSGTRPSPGLTFSREVQGWLSISGTSGTMGVGSICGQGIKMVTNCHIALAVLKLNYTYFDHPIYQNRPSV